MKTCDELDLAVDELVVLECVGSEPRSIFSSDSELLFVPVVEVLPVNLLVLKLWRLAARSNCPSTFGIMSPVNGNQIIIKNNNKGCILTLIKFAI